MGMSSSQARLLTLTARMHDIEYKAQRIEAKKLQLANDSRHAYEDYLRVLDAKKVQYKSIMNDGSVTFMDATLSSLENGAPKVVYDGQTSASTYLVKTSDTNEILVTEEFAAAYGITDGDTETVGTLDQYLRDNGANTDPVMDTVPDYSNITSVNPVNNVEQRAYREQMVDGDPVYSLPTGDITKTNVVDNFITTTSNRSGNITPASAVDEPINYTYGTTGSYTAAVDTSTEAGYTVTNGITTNPSSSVYTETENKKKLVNAETIAEGMIGVGTTQKGTEELEKDEFIITPQEYTVRREKIQYDIADLNLTMEQLNTKYGLGIDFTNSSHTKLDIKVTSGVVGNVYGYSEAERTENIEYNSTDKFSEFLQKIANKYSTIEFDETNGILLVNTASRSSSPTLVASNYNNQLDELLFNNKLESYSQTLTFGSSTKMADYLASDIRGTTNYGDIDIDNAANNLPSYRYMVGGNPPEEFTYADYFNHIIEYMPDSDCSWTENSEGLHLLIGNGHRFTGAHGGSHLNTEQITHNVRTDTTDISLDLGAIAENIYLAQCIVGEKTDEYYAEHHDAETTTIKNQITSSSGFYHISTGTFDNQDSANENIRQLALFSDALNKAFEDYNASTPKDKSILQGALSLFGTEIIDTEKYLYNSENKGTPSTSGHHTVNKYTTIENLINYTITNSSTSITPKTTEVGTGTYTVTSKGKFKNIPSNEDIKEYLAKEVLYKNDNTTSYNDYLTQLNGYTGLSDYQWALVFVNKGNSALTTALKTSEAAVIGWINGLSEAKYHSDKLDSDHYEINRLSGTDNYSCTYKPATTTAKSPKVTDIINYLAHEMCVTGNYTDKTPEEWATYITNQFGASGQNYTDEQVASISYMYGEASTTAAKKAILEKIKDNNTLDTSITDNFNGYTISWVDGNYSLNTTSTGGAHYISTNSKEDLMEYFAYSICGGDVSGTVVNETDYNAKKNALNAFSLGDLANLSRYVGTSDWSTIVDTLTTNINSSNLRDSVKTYIEKDTSGDGGYNPADYTTYTPISGDKITVSFPTSGTDEHVVKMDTEHNIATRLASDIYKLNDTLNPGNNTLNPENIYNSILGFGQNVLAKLGSYYGKSEWDDEIVAKLLSGINSTGTVNLNNIAEEYRKAYESRFSFEYLNTTSIGDITHSTPQVLAKYPGQLNIPTIEGIASNLVAAFRKAGYEVDEADIVTKLTEKYGDDTQDNNEILANINQEGYNYLTTTGSSDISNIYDNLFGSSALSVTNTWKKEKYNITRTNLGKCSANYGTKQVDTGRTTWRHDDLYNQLVEKWNFLKAFEGSKFKIIHDRDLANSYEYVRNLICEAGAYLLKFDLSKSDESENLAKVLVDTNVSIETSLQEVSDEKELKKAEAKYEADMRAIDRKDRKYDTELAACDTERNAIKQEMDTLKTVAKDNVDRTFKLFG